MIAVLGFLLGLFAQHVKPPFKITAELDESSSAVKAGRAVHAVVKSRFRAATMMALAEARKEKATADSPRADDLPAVARRQASGGPRAPPVGSPGLGSDR